MMKQEVIRGEDSYCCTLSKEVQEVAKVDLNETAKVRKKALAEVRKWIRCQPQIKRARLDSNFILRFLRMQKFEIKESCEILDKYLTMRCQYPTWFQNLDCQDPALADLVSRGYIFVLPERDQHGRRVIFSRAAAFDPTKYTTSDMMRAHVMTFETLLANEENQVRGFTYVFDEKAVSWSHLSIWTPSEVSKAFSCCERALPMRHRDINFLNLPWTMSLIFQFAKSLLSEKIRSRFKTHSGLESLQRSVDPSFLPAEYGGTTSVADCIASWKSELEDGRAELLQLDQLKVDSNAPVGEQLALVRKKSRHDSGSGSEVSTNSVKLYLIQPLNMTGAHMVDGSFYVGQCGTFCSQYFYVAGVEYDGEHAKARGGALIQWRRCKPMRPVIYL